MIKRFLLSALALCAQTVAADTLYKCPGADGRMTYTNQKTGKNCEIISQDKPVSTVAAPEPKAKPQQQPTPTDFPKVSGDQQKARDSDRRVILEKELATEQKSLEAAKRELTEQENLVLPEERVAGGGIQTAKREARVQSYRDKIQLHQRNIESIRREIANLK